MEKPQAGSLLEGSIDGWRVDVYSVAYGSKCAHVIDNSLCRSAKSHQHQEKEQYSQFRFHDLYFSFLMVLTRKGTTFLNGNKPFPDIFPQMGISSKATPEGAALHDIETVVKGAITCDLLP